MRKSIWIKSPHLSYYDNDRYPLEHVDLEGGPKWKDTDMNWSPEICHIGEVRVQKKTLYKSFDGPKRRFVREELLHVNDGVELPPESVLHR
ncbi:hypothetical protein RclHR1_05070008 [Rhizophagus clarus]|uniref:Uncharacterized protein n=1 Tax=Rhizophagus clarus TaxID=94130 RepID=A0A2Z6RLT8_9GLOM|nr:hypothetical protein RclHR1_05070008 [Rhizophagus clarus]